jgi:hypothetical protein
MRAEKYKIQITRTKTQGPNNNTQIFLIIVQTHNPTKMARIKKRGIRDNTTPSPGGHEDDIAYIGLAAIFSIIIHAIVKGFRRLFKKK